VRAEARLSGNTSRGTDHLDTVKRVIRRRYTTLAESHDWQHLRLSDTDGTKTLAAGQRYYDFPTAVNPGRIACAHVQWGNTWLRVEYGIGIDDYNIFDSLADERSDPTQKWAFRSDSQFEVWPIPATNDVSFRFTGDKKIEALTDNDSRLDLDDELVTLFAAAELLASAKQDDAETKMALAQARLSQLKGNYGTRSRVRIGLGRVPSDAAHDASRTTLYIRG
jgi:hypothetical protein